MQLGLRPFFCRRSLLTQTERRFYDVLRSIVDEQPVFLKVRLADLVAANEQHEKWLPNFRRICSKHIDFVVCDPELRPLVAIELDDRSHQRPDRQKRDEDVNRILELARLPLLRIFARKNYNSELISRLLSAKLKTNE